jgi:hypothetical protein
MKLTFLMPRNLRFLGIIFIVLGLILGISRFYFGNKPDMLEMKMFAFSSSYLDTKYMEIVRNNLSEEITGFFLVAGLFLIAFSREKEENEQKNNLRLKAFYITAYLNFLFLLVSLFFTFGFAFIYMLIANMGISLLSYIVVFRTLLLQNHSIKSDQ